MFSRYLILLSSAFFFFLLLIWAYVAMAPMAYRESGYAAWLAKMRMLNDCQLGKVAFIGDSRLDSGIVPELMTVPVDNLGFVGASPIVVTSAVRRLVACTERPNQVVLSLAPEHFGPVDQFFWSLALRYGFISPGELWQTEQLSTRLGDILTFSERTPDGFSGLLRDWLFELNFPSLSFSSLLQARVFGRWKYNWERLATIQKSRGWFAYSGPGSTPYKRPQFQITKLEAADFGAALKLLRDHGVQASFLIMPIPDNDVPDPESEQAYLAALDGFADRDSQMIVLDPKIPLWPPRLFADQNHLNAEGAKELSKRLAACMPAGVLVAPCDLSWSGMD